MIFHLVIFSKTKFIILSHIHFSPRIHSFLLSVFTFSHFLFKIPSVLFSFTSYFILFSLFCFIPPPFYPFVLACSSKVGYTISLSFEVAIVNRLQFTSVFVHITMFSLLLIWPFIFLSLYASWFDYHVFIILTVIFIFLIIIHLIMFILYISSSSILLFFLVTMFS